MLIEKSLNEALADYAEGRKVIVLVQKEDGSTEAVALAGILKNEHRYLVDVQQESGSGQSPPEEKETGIFPEGKDKKEEAGRMSAQGMTVKEISRKLGIPYGTVYGWVRKRKPDRDSHGGNADRHLCQTCRFRAKPDSKRKGFGCDYIEHTGKRRGCAVEDCTVYEKGSPEEIKTGDED